MWGQIIKECMVPSKLKIHLNTKHSHLSGKCNYFSQLLSFEAKKTKAMVWRTTTSEKAQVACYNVAEIVAKTSNPTLSLRL